MKSRPMSLQPLTGDVACRPRQRTGFVRSGATTGHEMINRSAEPAVGIHV